MNGRLKSPAVKEIDIEETYGEFVSICFDIHNITLI